MQYKIDTPPVRLLMTPLSSITLIGDPHLGRKFQTGVPMHRRGEREHMQFEDFKAQMLTDINPTLIVMGDLFDKFIVDYDVIYKTYRILVEANKTGGDIFILQGNHDVSRNSEQKSSLDLLEIMSVHLENIKFVREVDYHTTRDGGELCMFVPYSEFSHTRDLVSAELALGAKPVMAFGHWDIESFGNDHNVVPLDLLAPYCKYVVTGHIHQPQCYVVDLQGNPIDVSNNEYGNTEQASCQLVVTGSMQPYSFAEDEYQALYATMTLKEYQISIDNFGNDIYHDKCIRLLLKPGEEPPTDVDALQFIYKHVNENLEEVVEAKMEVFSFKEIFEESMTNNNVSEEDKETLWKRYEEVANDAINT